MDECDEIISAEQEELFNELLERTLDLEGASGTPYHIQEQERTICFNFRRDNVVRGSENICQV